MGKYDSGARSNLTTFGLLVLINEARCLAGKIVQEQHAIMDDPAQGHRMVRLGSIYLRLVARIRRRSALWAATSRATKPGKPIGHTTRKRG